MILWVDGAHDARENMRRDARLLRAAALPGAEPVLRLFQFAPPAITLGYGQDPERELDLVRCAEQGVAWAIRPTGGRAILHVQEWTFSFARPFPADAPPGAASEVYARTCAWLVEALRALGVPAESGRAAPAPDARPTAGLPAAPCFESLARHEVTLHGRKLAGIAQRRAGGALLQQGSILLGPGHRRLPEYQRLEPAARAAATERLARHAVEAGPILGAIRGLASFAAALAGVVRPSTTLEGGAGMTSLLETPVTSVGA